MLLASDYGSVDEMFPFFGSIAHMMHGNIEMAIVINMFTKCV